MAYLDYMRNGNTTVAPLSSKSVDYHLELDIIKKLGFYGDAILYEYNTIR